jgi:hypothetical protein
MRFALLYVSSDIQSNLTSINAYGKKSDVCGGTIVSMLNPNVATLG